MSPRSPNELRAAVLVDELVRTGVREVVVAPGSRSTPLVLAVASRSELRVVVQIDERAAAFLALGVGKATGRPAAVVTTSGTAAANLFPAVVEAAQAEVPLLVLTADRPRHLRGADANQAIDQEYLFGRYPRFYQEVEEDEPTEAHLRYVRSVTSRAVAAAVGAAAGAVHLNLPFRKPLEPAGSPGGGSGGGSAGDDSEHGAAERSARSRGAPYTRIHSACGVPAREEVGRLAAALAAADRPLLVAGTLPRPWEAGPLLRRFSATWRIPLLADPLSGARYPAAGEPQGGDSPPVLGSYDTALREAAVRDRLRPDLVVRFGAAPGSAALVDWLAELRDVPQVVIDAGERWKDHLAVASEVIRADPGLLAAALADPDFAVGALGNPAIAGASGDAGLLVAAPGDPGLPAAPPEDAGLPAAHPEDPDPPAAAPGDAAERSGNSRWTDAWRSLDAALRPLLPSPDPPRGLEGAILQAVAGHVAPDDVIFVSSSMPVRDLDTFVPHCAAPLLVLGNRGASGIDGITSTAAGAALGSGRRVVAVVGDLAFLHDAAGLAVLREQGVRVVVVVVNNDGGGIFHMLPVRSLDPPFTRLFATPHGRDLSHLAALHQLPFRSLDFRAAGEGTDDLASALDWASALEESAILEIRTDREENRRLREAVLERALRTARAEVSRGADPSGDR